MQTHTTFCHVEVDLTFLFLFQLALSALFRIKHRNCEDIAMSFLVAQLSGHAAVWVRGAGIREIGSSGLSSDQVRILVPTLTTQQNGTPQ